MVNCRTGVEEYTRKWENELRMKVMENEYLKAHGNIYIRNEFDEEC